MQNKESNREIKEDFSGFTEVTIHDTNDEPIKMDVSDAVSGQTTQVDENENVPMLPGVVNTPVPKGTISTNFSPNQLSNQLPSDHPHHLQDPHLQSHHLQPPNQTPNQPPNQPSFWQSLLSRGVTILIVAGIIVLLWWLWTSYSKGASTTMEQMTEMVQENVVEPVKRVFKLPPQL
jgi:ABC-type nickel/cobalt efflux system permease component RcnA